MMTRPWDSGAEETTSPPATAIAPAPETSAPNLTPPPANPTAETATDREAGAHPKRGRRGHRQAKHATGRPRCQRWSRRSSAPPSVSGDAKLRTVRFHPGRCSSTRRSNPQPPPRLSTAGIRAIACARPCSSASRPIPAPVTARTAATPSAVSPLTGGESSCGADGAVLHEVRFTVR